jgi:DNA-directed RNA polymerase specialized sigma subunit
MHQVNSFNNSLLVALSAADTNKWATLLNRGEPTLKSEITSFDYERTGPIRQRQRRLNEAKALLMANKFQDGATVYQLAQEFGISRHTVSERLKKAGVTMRQQSPGSELIDSMVEIYEAGLTLAEVGERVGTSPGTVHRYIRIHGLQTRDSHGRRR